VAKLASGMAKPDGMLLVPRAATLELLHSLPVAALWGVGERTRGQLARWGIATVAELAHSEPALVQRAVGTAVGRHLYDLAWGRDPRPVVPEHREKSIGAETTFETDTTDLRWIDGRLLELADRCAGRLRSAGLVGRTVSLKVRTADWQTLTRSRTLPAATDVAREVHAAARDLLAGVDLQGRAVRLVGVRVDGLADAGGRQPTLDEAVGDDGTRRASRAVDEVRGRFGDAAVRLAATLGGRSTTVSAPGDLS
jgi:DNA polymerase-4